MALPTDEKIADDLIKALEKLEAAKLKHGPPKEVQISEGLFVKLAKSFIAQHSPGRAVH